MGRPSDAWLLEHGFGTAPDRLTARADRIGECLVYRTAQKQAQIRLFVDGQEWTDSVVRLAWVLEHGLPYPPSHLWPMRRCGTPNCIEPSHLELRDRGDPPLIAIERAWDRRARGARHPAAKLSSAQARSIRRRARRRGDITRLAREFGVTPSAVSFVLHGLSHRADNEKARWEPGCAYCGEPHLTQQHPADAEEARR